MEDIHLTEENNTLTVSYQGEIVMDTISGLKDYLDREMESRVFKLMVFDMAEVRFVDSSGISFLVYLNTVLRNGHKSLVLLHPRTHVLKTIELVRLLSFFDIALDKDELLTKLPF